MFSHWDVVCRDSILELGDICDGSVSEQTSCCGRGQQCGCCQNAGFHGGEGPDLAGVPRKAVLELAGTRHSKVEVDLVFGAGKVLAPVVRAKRCRYVDAICRQWCRLHV